MRQYNPNAITQIGMDIFISTCCTSTYLVRAYYDQYLASTWREILSITLSRDWSVIGLA